MTSASATHAMQAYRSGRRRRMAAGAVERVADAVMATGGVLVANAALPLGLGLPTGRTGLSLGSAFLCAGLAWMTHRRGHRRPRRLTGATMPTPRPALATQAPIRQVRKAA